VWDLVADRFVRLADGRALDLATGCEVHLDRSWAAAHVELEAPGWFEGRALVDAGPLDASAWFAAWSSRPWQSPGESGGGTVRHRLAAAAEILDGSGDAVRRCSLASGVPTRLEFARLVLAREARLRGIVPVGASVLARHPEVTRAVSGRGVALFVVLPAERDVLGMIARRAALASTAGLRIVVWLAFGEAFSATMPVIDLDSAVGARAVTLDRPREPARAARVAEPAHKGPGPGATRRHRPASRQEGRSESIDESRAAARAREALLGARRAALDGRPREAEAAARSALDAGCRDRPGVALDAVTVLAHAWIDQWRLSQAFDVLNVAVETSRLVSQAPCTWALLAQARCLLWLRRFDDAERLIDHASLDPSPQAWRSVVRMRARVLLARSEAGRAGAFVGRLLRQAVPDPADRAATHLLAVCLQGAMGDIEGVRRHASQGLEACRAGGLAVRELATRVARLEAAARLGVWGDVQRDVRYLTRARPALTAPLMRMRVDRALDAARHAATRGTCAAFGETAAGVGVATHTPTGGPRGGRIVVDELLEVLTVLHEVDEGMPTLDRVCVVLRARLGASSLCLVGGSTSIRLAHVGHHRTTSDDVMHRAVATGEIVPIARVDDGWETAVPVRYGGATIGALACRWAIDAAPDRARAEPVLATAAAACAPSVRAVLDRLAASRVADAGDLGIVGTSAGIERVRSAIVKAAAVPFHVLIEGESGSGKELVARAIHRVGPRRQRRFCAVNCAALPDDLLEAELFGHARGAFTGAVGERAGLFEEADGGTLFLDEIGELSPRGQAKLLRAIQENEIRRLGETLPRRVDVRIVAATNRSLGAEAQAGRFRVDLRYRLEVVRIVIPPLRDRREDIALLSGVFWSDCARRAGTRALLDRSVLDALARHDWPGNVRELQNVLASLAVHAPKRGRVGVADLPVALGPSPLTRGSTLDEARRAFETGYVREALSRAGGRRSAAARELGVTRQGLSKLMARLGVADAGGPSAPFSRDASVASGSGLAGPPRGRAV
jgi:DNA-binding NtrC family response regulator